MGLGGLRDPFGSKVKFWGYRIVNINALLEIQGASSAWLNKRLLKTTKRVELQRQKVGNKVFCQSDQPEKNETRMKSTHSLLDT